MFGCLGCSVFQTSGPFLSVVKRQKKDIHLNLDELYIATIHIGSSKMCSKLARRTCKSNTTSTLRMEKKETQRNIYGEKMLCGKVGKVEKVGSAANLIVYICFVLLVGKPKKQTSEQAWHSSKEGDSREFSSCWS